jgi:hypothetical protein
MKKTTLTILLVVLNVLQLTAQCDYEQTTDSYNASFPSDWNSGVVGRDDFFVPAGQTWTITRVFATMRTEATTMDPEFTIDILDDQMNYINAANAYSDNVIPHYVATLPSGKIINNYEMWLDVPMVLTGGASGTMYFLQITGGSSSFNYSFEWETNQDAGMGYGLDAYVYDMNVGQLFITNSDFVFKIVRGTVSTQQLTTCDSLTWIDGNTYGSTTANFLETYAHFPYAAASGCDSVVKLELTINHSIHATQTVTACGSYTWIDGITYTATNYTATHTLAGVTNSGCDSVMTLNLTVYPLPTPTITHNSNGELVASNAVSYDWYDCLTNTLIPTATQQTFQASQNGSYAVIVSNAYSCSDTSACEIVNELAVDDLSLNAIEMYPNPTSGELHFSGNDAVLKIEIFDVNGKIVLTEKLEATESLNLSSFENGIYTIRLMSDSAVSVKKVVLEK